MCFQYQHTKGYFHRFLPIPTRQAVSPLFSPAADQWKRCALCGLMKEARLNFHGPAASCDACCGRSKQPGSPATPMARQGQCWAIWFADNARTRTMHANRTGDTTQAASACNMKLFHHTCPPHLHQICTHAQMPPPFITPMYTLKVFVFRNDDLFAFCICP